MFNSIMVYPLFFKIANIIYGLFLGIFFPFTVAYLVIFYRKKRYSGFKLFLKLILRFLFICLIYSIINTVIVLLMGKTLFDQGFAFSWFSAGLWSGFFGGIIMFIIGFRRGKRSASKT